MLAKRFWHFCWINNIKGTTAVSQPASQASSHELFDYIWVFTFETLFLHLNRLKPQMLCTMLEEERTSRIRRSNSGKNVANNQPICLVCCVQDVYRTILKGSIYPGAHAVDSLDWFVQSTRASFLIKISRLNVSACLTWQEMAPNRWDDCWHLERRINPVFVSFFDLKTI